MEITGTEMTSWLHNARPIGMPSIQYLKWKNSNNSEMVHLGMEI
jgi:hypothetical protein